jgi:hypothetical protein
MFLQLPNQNGRGPESMFPSAENEITFSRADSSSGMGPLRALNARSMTYKRRTTSKIIPSS